MAVSVKKRRKFQKGACAWSHCVPQGEAGQQQAKLELTSTPTAGPEGTSARRQGHSGHKGARGRHCRPERPGAPGAGLPRALESPWHPCHMVQASSPFTKEKTEVRKEGQSRRTEPRLHPTAQAQGAAEWTRVK